MKGLNELNFDTPIANMATMAPKRGFSVVTVAKAAQPCVFEEIYTKLHLRGVVKVSAIIKAVFAFVLLCIFEFVATTQWQCLLKCLIDFYCLFFVS